MATRRFPAPWQVKQIAGGYKVLDHKFIDMRAFYSALVQALCLSSSMSASGPQPTSMPKPKTSAFGCKPDVPNSPADVS
jgi:hypothetical protein